MDDGIEFSKADRAETLTAGQIDLLARTRHDIFICCMRERPGYFDIERIRLLMDLGVIEAKRRAAAQGPVDVNVSPLPWADCKVAFGIDDDESIDAEWNLRDGMLDTQLPPGWSMNEIDCAGSRAVAVFRVEVPLKREDGEAVGKLLRRIERANAPQSPAAQQPG